MADGSDGTVAEAGEAARAEAAASPPGSDAEPLRLDPLLVFRTPTLLQRLAATVAAWAITVAPAGFSALASPVAKVLTVISLLAGVTGVVVSPTRTKLGRHLGVSLFLVMSLGVWITSGEAISTQRLEVTLAMMGTLAWGAFALTWRDPWSPSRRAEPTVAEPLPARASISRMAVPMAAAGVLGGLACLVFAWRIVQPDRAIVGQAVAVLCAVALIAQSAHVATERGKHRRRPLKRLPTRAAQAVILLVLVGMLGAAVLVLRD